MDTLDEAITAAEEAIAYAALGDLDDDDAAEVYAAVALLVSTGAVDECHMSGEGVTVRIGGAA